MTDYASYAKPYSKGTRGTLRRRSYAELSTNKMIFVLMTKTDMYGAGAGMWMPILVVEIRIILFFDNSGHMIWRLTIRSATWNPMMYTTISLVSTYKSLVSKFLFGLVKVTTCNLSLSVLIFELCFRPPTRRRWQGCSQTTAVFLGM